jgi:fructose/tagatose bisphosphate aldolase
VPIALCLDECRNFNFIINCIKCGFSFVMFDGASSEHENTEPLKFEDNIEITRNIVKIAHAANVSVEASIGEMPLSKSGVLSQMEKTGTLTDPLQAAEFAKSTGIDILAPSIGNIHCLYAEKWPEPDWVLAEEIVKKSGIPCALHGASGARDDQIRKAISIGFRKINIGTRYNEIYRKALIEELQKCEGLGCPYNSSIIASNEFKKEARRLMRDVYKSSGRFKPSGKKYWTMEKVRPFFTGSSNEYIIEEIPRNIRRDIEQKQS